MANQNLNINSSVSLPSLLIFLMILMSFKIGSVDSFLTLHFPSCRSRSRLIHMGALMTTWQWVPLLPSILTGHSSIPIWKTVITLEHMDSTHSFLMAYCYHPVFLQNKALRDINQDVIWKGDLVICKLGVYEGYVNLYPGYDQLVAFCAVTQWVLLPLMMIIKS